MDFCGLKFENPFVLAPSPCSDNPALLEKAFAAGWAGAVFKTVSMRSGNISRVFPLVTRVESEDGRLIALQNIDLISDHPAEVIAERVYNLKKKFPDKIVMTSIMGNGKEEWQTLAKLFKDAGVDIIQCSFSCPHGTEGDLGIRSHDPVVTERVVRWVKEAVPDIPVVIKLSPQVPDIAAIAAAAKQRGADGVCAINTVKIITGINLDTLIPYPNVGGLSTFGGLSGPALKPVALRCTAEIARKVNIDIAASGGITTWRDAAEFLLLGAKTLQVCTAVLRYGIEIISGLSTGLQVWMDEKGFQNSMDVVGMSLPYMVEHAQLPRGIQVVAKIQTENCNNCYACQIACRSGGHEAIGVEEGHPVVDPDQCHGCGLCLAVCPIDAVTLIRPNQEMNNEIFRMI